MRTEFFTLSNSLRTSYEDLGVRYTDPQYFLI